MALDGLFLYELSLQLAQELNGSRVEKIYQPSKEELVFVMRTKEGAKKLYVNSRADSARVHISSQSFINPQNPPMLCMLLRKKFTSARLDAVRQDAFERILCFEFSALNDFGDRVPLKMICEIMGRYSNVIFLDENDVIIDCVKRVGANKSSVRELLPGKAYTPPPPQEKLLLTTAPVDSILESVFENQNAMLSKALLKSVKGLSPLLCNELAFCAYGEDLPVYEASQKPAPLGEALTALRESLHAPNNACILKENDKPIAFSFADIRQFGDLCRKEYYTSLSALLDAYFSNAVNTVKRTQSGGELLKKLHSLIEKLSRKLAIQRKELEACEGSEELKLYGELINANLYYLENSVSVYSVVNYYTGETIDIPADILLTPTENAAKYYKEYRKKQNAKAYISEQIRQGEEQLDYLESVLDILERAESIDEITALKRELISQGYLKAKVLKREKNTKELKPLEFLTSGGLRVLVGRNNLSNDKLTFKLSHGNDFWFHTKNIHGSHTVLVTGAAAPTEEDIIEAAGICAYYSKARDALNVPVDYTRIKFVKRQPGNIPGRVFYTDYKTVYVNPDKEEIEKLKR